MADQQLRDLTEETDPGSGDLVYVVTDPDGAAANRKVKLGNLPGVQGDGVTDIVAIEQDDYDLLDPPDAATLYVIVESS